MSTDVEDGVLAHAPGQLFDRLTDPLAGSASDTGARRLGECDQVVIVERRKIAEGGHQRGAPAVVVSP